ncbi:armadillo-type protein [Phakopsora pachyrhizi]|uniref:Importin-95 n=1 Tax=Phakopsora pachyrhizi TaxID=170000 RepID=A0AAV0BI52_PHAPC|nr:armadillo-type protein [Phakopsora pachyrhizi]
MDAATLLANTLSPDPALRSSATTQLETASRDHVEPYLESLILVLTSSDQPAHIRNAAGLAIKNALTSRESTRNEELIARWKSVSDEARQKIKDGLLSMLGDDQKQVRQVSGQAIAAIGAVELPLSMWPTLIGQLLQIVNNQESGIPLRQATLQAIGYLCESTIPEVLATQSNEILTAVVSGARKEEPSSEVQLAAVSALYNSLEFVRENFEREGERNYIMQVVCEATQSPTSDVQVTAFACLVKIMQLYYDKMNFYMERALFGLTVLGMKHADDRVVLQAIEFWSTVCDEEIELQIEAEEAMEYCETPERESQHFAKVALPEILPVLLQLLTKQSEDADEDEWNVSMAAGTSLALLAQTVGDIIVNPVIPFVESKIKSADWHERDAAVMAFGSILDGPDFKVLDPLVSQALPTLIEMMRDPSPHVQDTAAWTLGRVTDQLVSTINPETHLEPLITALINGLSDNTRIVGNCCWGLMNLSEQLGDPTQPTTVLSRFYEGIAKALIEFSERVSDEPTSRTSAYEALGTLIKHAPEDALTVVSNALVVILERSERMLAMQGQLVGDDDRRNYVDLQVAFCAVLTHAIRRLGKDVKPMADRTMTLVLHLIQGAGQKSPILDDAFLAVGAMTFALETDFLPYLPAFLPFLDAALKSHEEYPLCSIGVGIVGDICRGLGEQASPYAQNFMELLLQDLQSTVLHRSVKPPILSCFGDIALAIGGNFAPYLDTTIGVLQQAGAMRADPSNFDLVDYINQLREGILEAYAGILAGLKAADKSELLLSHCGTICAFLHVVVTDPDKTEELLKGALGIIGDLAEIFPNGQIKSLLDQQWVAEALKAGRNRSGSPEIKKLSKWAKEMVRRAIQ